MVPAAGTSSTSTSSRRKGKKNGVPTRDKLSKAIALVQSSKQKVTPSKLDLIHLADGAEDHPRSAPMAHTSNDKPRSEGANILGNDFANNLYRAIHQENEPSPRQQTARPLTPRASAAAAAKKFKEQQQRQQTDGNHKNRAKAPQGAPNGPATSAPLTPRATAAAAISAEKRRSRARSEKLEETEISGGTPKQLKSTRKSAQEALAHANTQLARAGSSSSGGRRVNPSGRYHRDLNYKSHKEDVEAAMKFSNDIEKDIQATSQTLAKISEFIDTVSSPPKKETRSNNSFVQFYQQNLDDRTINSCAAIAEVNEAREPEPTRTGAAEDDAPREKTSRDVGVWDLEQFAGAGMQNTGRIYLEDKSELDSTATYASKAASIFATEPSISKHQTAAVYSATIKLPTEDTPLVKKEAPKPKKEAPKAKKDAPKSKKEPIKQSSFDALLNVAAATLSENYMTNCDKLDTVQVNSDKSSKQQNPIRIGSIDDRMNKGKSTGSKHLADGPSQASSQSKNSAQSEDPPDMSLQPHTMGSQDELQPKDKGHFSFDSHDSSLEVLGVAINDSLDTPKHPQLLSQISAFIDKVEQKNQNGKKSNKPVAAYKDPMHEALDNSTFANDFDAEMLTNFFDEPLTPRIKRDKEVARTKKEVHIEKGPQKKCQAPNSKEVHDLIEKAKSNGAFSEDTTLASKLPDKESTWLEMEQLLNQLSVVDTGQKRRVQVDASSSSSVALTINSSSTSSSRRGADPPTNASGAARTKKDPPAEIVPPPPGGGSQTEATPRNRTGKEQVDSPFFASSPRKVSQDGTDGTTAGNRSSKKQREPSPRSSDEVLVVDVETSVGPKVRGGPPKPDDLPTPTPKQANPLSVDVGEPGTEATPINVECRTPGTPAPHASEKPEPLVFVDLTAVCSGDICKDEDEKEIPTQISEPVVVDPKSPKSRDGPIRNSTKQSHNAEPDFSVQEKALKELLSMADTPRKPNTKTAVHSFEHVLSVETEDGASLSDTSGSAEIVSDAGKQDTPPSNGEHQPCISIDASDDKDGNTFEELLSSNGVVISSTTKPDKRDDKATATEDGAYYESTGEGSTRSKQPPGGYTDTGSGEDNQAETKDKRTRGGNNEGEANDDQADHEDFLALVGSRASQIVSEDDHDPIQSLLFARNKDADELTSERKEAGLSLIQLTLDEVKNFVDSDLFENSGVSPQRIRELEQLDQSVPSFLTDLVDENIHDQLGSILETQEDSCADDGQLEEESDADRSLNDDQGITVTYNFQSAPEEVVNGGGAAKYEKTHRKSLHSRKRGKKGLKRKFSTEEQSPKNASSAPEPSNWLASLDHIFSCKHTEKGKTKGKSAFVMEASSGEEAYQDIQSDPSSFYRSSFEPSSFDPSVKSAAQPKLSDPSSFYPPSFEPSSFDPSVESAAQPKVWPEEGEPDETSEVDRDNIPSPPAQASHVAPEDEELHPAWSAGNLGGDPIGSQQETTETANSEETREDAASSGEDHGVVRCVHTEDNSDATTAVAVVKHEESIVQPTTVRKDEHTDGLQPIQTTSNATPDERAPSSFSPSPISLSSSDEGNESEKIEPAEHADPSVCTETKPDAPPSSPPEMKDDPPEADPLIEPADDNEEDTKHFAMAAEMEPAAFSMLSSEEGKESDPSRESFNGPPNDEKSSTCVFGVSSSGASGSKANDVSQESLSTKDTANDTFSANESAVPPSCPPEESTRESKKKEKPNLFKFASQSDYSPATGSDIIDETHDKKAVAMSPKQELIENDLIDTTKQSGTARNSPNVEEQQDVSSDKGAKKQSESSVQQPLPAKTKETIEQPYQGIVADEAEQSEDTSAHEKTSSQPQESNASDESGQMRARSPDLLKFASQSDSIANISDEAQELKTEASSSWLPPNVVEQHDPLGKPPRWNNGQVAGNHYQEDDESLPDRYEVEMQASSEEVDADNGDLGSLCSVESPQHGASSSAAGEEDQNGKRQQPPSGAWEKFVDLTNLEQDETEAEKEDKVKYGNAWEISLDLGSHQELSSSNNTSWDKPHGKQIVMQKQRGVETDNMQEASETCQSPRDDHTPMHQNKRFDFIEDVNEDDNNDACFSRKANLKQGGHLPNLDIKVLGSYGDADADADAEGIEIDLDAGFVKKSLAPILSDVDEDDERVECSNRYISIEESADEEEHREPLSRPRLDTISDGDEEVSSSYVPSSSSYADRVLSDEERSLGSCPERPIVAESASMTDNENDTFPIYGIADTGRPDLTRDYNRSMSYESDNDEWLRKRDLATRKTLNPNKSWLTRTTSGIQSKLSFVTVETPKAINGVASARKLCSRQPKLRGGRHRNPIPSSKTWKLAYKERTKDHSGYFDVDFFSLFDSSAVGVLQPHHLDLAPWESRDVRQHFLHDHSVGFSKNWFGKAQRTRGNDRIKERVAHPKSMEMPMENPEEWTEEWYTTWKAPNSNSNSRSVTSTSRSGTDQEGTEESDSATLQDETSSYVEESSHSYSRFGGGSSYSTAGNLSASEGDFTDGEYDEYEDTPQCGTLINVKPKIGERVSRIHPDYTSQLRRSRWRKKYFPRGTFPYDK